MTSSTSVSRPWIRTIYIYLLSLIGILLLTIGSIRMLDMALKTWVFTEVDREEMIREEQPPMPHALDRVQRMAEGEAELSEAERAQVRQWLSEYERWQERREAVDSVRARRQRTASSALAMILIGLPLYLYHWRLVRRES